MENVTGAYALYEFLKELVEKKRVCFHKSFDNWEDAIQASCEPLLEEHVI